MFSWTDPATSVLDRTSSDVHVVGANLEPLSCTARGIPIPTITWLKNGQPLSASSRIVISTSPPTYFPSEEEAEFASRRSTLFILALELVDSGVYICQAENTGAPGNIFTVDSDPLNISVQCKTTCYCLNIKINLHVTTGYLYDDLFWS